MENQLRNQAPLSRVLDSRTSDQNSRALANVLTVGAGVILLALLAQLSIRVPWTPVPITGQTFGVAFVSLLYGRKRGFATVALYLAAGSVGLPVFAHLSAGAWGPTAGYLIGMLFASFAMGSLADRGWTRSVFTTWAAAFIGSAITFTCGLTVLSLFVPRESVLAFGLIPFLPGDLVKTFIVTMLTATVSKASDRA